MSNRYSVRYVHRTVYVNRHDEPDFGRSMEGILEWLLKTEIGHEMDFMEFINRAPDILDGIFEELISLTGIEPVQEKYMNPRVSGDSFRNAMIVKYPEYFI